MWRNNTVTGFFCSDLMKQCMCSNSFEELSVIELMNTKNNNNIKGAGGGQGLFWAYFLF